MIIIPCEEEAKVTVGYGIIHIHHAPICTYLYLSIIRIWVRISSGISSKKCLYSFAVE